MVGRDRLPSFDDIGELPYVEAVIKETLRWHPMAPLGLPRAAEKDGEYRGYRIPKGAILLPTLAWFTQDPAVYHERELFKPERYMAPYNEPDPRSYMFGFGRRVCPGRLLADAVLALTVARTLAVFDIKQAVDENGKKIEPPTGGTPGIVHHPLPFRYNLVPKSEKHVELIRSVEIDHPWEEGNAGFLETLKDRDWTKYA